MKEYTTTDFRRATLLLTLGHPIISTSVGEGGVRSMHFEYTDSLVKDVDTYNNGDISVCPRQFFDLQGHVHDIGKRHVGDGNTHYTGDFKYAATMMAMGHKVNNVINTGNKNFMIVFENSQKFKDDTLSFHNGEIRLPVSLLCEKQEKVKMMTRGHDIIDK